MKPNFFKVSFTLDLKLDQNESILLNDGMKGKFWVIEFKHIKSIEQGFFARSCSATNSRNEDNDCLIISLNLLLQARVSMSTLLVISYTQITNKVR
jgi:hypothetical protein